MNTRYGYSGSGYGMPTLDDLQGIGMASAADADSNLRTVNPLSFGADYGANAPMGLSMGTDVDGSGSPTWGNMGITKDLMGGVQDAVNGGSGGLPDWMNWQNANYALQGLGQLSSIYFGIQKNKLAKEALDFKKKSYTENMDFQKKSYNTALEADAIEQASWNRAAPGTVTSYLDKHRL